MTRFVPAICQYVCETVLLRQSRDQFYATSLPVGFVVNQAVLWVDCLQVQWTCGLLLEKKLAVAALF
jgi:hypothetical protein